MLGGIAFPDATTLGWMAIAAAGGAGLVLSQGLRQRYYEWRIARRKARGKDIYYEELRALEEYQPGALSDEELRTQPARALGLGLYAATGAWVWLELDQDIGEMMLAGALVIGVMFALLRDMRKTDDELGIDAAVRDPMKGPPTILERYGKRLWELGGATFTLGVAGLFYAGSKFDESPDWMGYVIAVIVLVVIVGYFDQLYHGPRIGDFSEREVDDSRMVGAMFVGFMLLIAGIGAIVVFT